MCTTLKGIISNRGSIGGVSNLYINNVFWAAALRDGACSLRGEKKTASRDEIFTFCHQTGASVGTAISKYKRMPYNAVKIYWMIIKRLPVSIPRRSKAWRDTAMHCRCQTCGHYFPHNSQTCGDCSYHPSYDRRPYWYNLWQPVSNIYSRSLHTVVVGAVLICGACCQPAFASKNVGWRTNCAAFPSDSPFFCYFCFFSLPFAVKKHVSRVNRRLAGRCEY